MKTYIELKNKEKEILENKKSIREANIKLIEELEQLSKTYPEEFRILPKNLELINFNKIHNRLDIIKEEIEISSIEEDKKKAIIELIDLIDRKLEINNQKSKKYEEESLKNKDEMEKREEHIKEKRPLLEEKVRKIASIMKKINSHYKLIGNDQIDDSVKEAAKKTISNLQEEKKLIVKEYEKIIKESNLKEDLDLFITKEKEELKNKEETEKLEENIQLNKQNVEQINKSGEKVNSQEQTLEKLKPIIPEEEQEVVDVRQAKKSFIAKLKKSGKVGLGVLTIGAAIAAVIANPLALAAIPAGGLLYEQTKEHLLKK